MSNIFYFIFYMFHSYKQNYIDLILTVYGLNNIL